MQGAPAGATWVQLALDDLGLAEGGEAQQWRQRENGPGAGGGFCLARADLSQVFERVSRGGSEGAESQSQPGRYLS